MSPVCIHCGKPIDPAQDYRKVIGWERQRNAGGTNALALREPQDEWSCRWCIDKQKRGVSLDQEALL